MARAPGENIDEKNSKISESGEGEEKRNGEAALASQCYHVVISYKYMAWMIVVCSLHGWMDGWMDDCSKDKSIVTVP
jgi:hypothetical protein